MPRGATSSAIPLQERSDEELARSARAGAASAFEALVARFEPRLMAFFRSRGVDRPAAEDLFQETVLQMWRRFDHYDTTRPLAPWLFTIAARLMIKTRMRRQREEARERIVGARATPRADNPSPVDDIAGSDASLWRLASEVLSPESHTALWLRYAEDMAPQHIAAVLGKRPGAVRVLLHRARRTLAEALTHCQAPAPREGAAS